MAVNYVKVKRTISTGNTPGEKFLARLLRGNDVNMNQVAEDIAYSTTLSPSDTLAVLMALEKVIGRYVMDGRAVKLGYLGSFSPQLSSKAVASPDEVDVNSIKRFGCRFFPSTEFRRNLAKASFIESDMSVKGLVSEE
ncbi:MAG: HU family DNA-binding protein [Bacteroidales bacterium]|nr:HU family DNA-binding protein [Bacteroidales bacterium]